MAPQSSGIMQFLPMVLIFGIFYLMIIRPEQKKRKEHQELLKNLKRGDKVVTMGGIHGTVQDVRDNTVMVEIDARCSIEIDKAAIATVLNKTA
ncbi:MAG: preprotein translocase subunit YajC [Elusimicrobia bacterium]|nr:preprotein translocase subunit YajC [Elusimicrobiota bacterium]